MLLSLSSVCAQSKLDSDNTAHKATEIVVPALSYSSVFARYHGYQDEAVTSWREINATVGRITGLTDIELGIRHGMVFDEAAGSHRTRKGYEVSLVAELLATQRPLCTGAAPAFTIRAPVRMPDSKEQKAVW